MENYTFTSAKDRKCEKRDDKNSWLNDLYTVLGMGNLLNLFQISICRSEGRLLWQGPSERQLSSHLLPGIWWTCSKQSVPEDTWDK